MFALVVWCSWGSDPETRSFPTGVPTTTYAPRSHPLHSSIWRPSYLLGFSGEGAGCGEGPRNPRPQLGRLLQSPLCSTRVLDGKIRLAFDPHPPSGAQPHFTVCPLFQPRALSSTAFRVTTFHVLTLSMSISLSITPVASTPLFPSHSLLFYLFIFLVPAHAVDH